MPVQRVPGSQATPESTALPSGGFDCQPLLVGLLRDSAKLLTLFVCSSTQINIEATERIPLCPLSFGFLGFRCP